MVAPISDDAEEARIAELVKQLIRDHGYTHDSFANEVGVSAGRVSQWATNRGGVPPERAMVVAKLLKTSPGAISLSWRRLRDEFLPSQWERLDADMIRAAITLAKKSLKLAHGDELVIERDPALFAQALRTAIAADKRKGGEGGSGSGDGQIGAIGSASSSSKDGSQAEAKPRRKREAG